MNIKNQLSIIFSFLLLSPVFLFAQRNDYTFELTTKKIGSPIQSTMFGLFFEDINFGADGGLYAELVKNRSFDFPQSLMGWNTTGNVTVTSENAPFDRNPNYLILAPTSHADKYTTIENEGFRSIGFTKDENYRFSVWAKKINSEGEQKIRIEFIDSRNNTIGSRELSINSSEWKQQEVEIKANRTEAKGKLRIFLTSKGKIAIDHVSLFPVNTYKNRKNGMRKDLAQALEDIHPGIFRFPGGCIVEGTEITDRYDWKKSIGPVENRPLNNNRWQSTFTYRYTPDYFQSYGMGFYEFFLLSEDIGAEPLPVLNCGLACQYQNKSESCHIAVDQLDGFIQDALDLIEFANGPVTSAWGKIRAEMGHPQSFNLKFIGIGNEQWGEEYVVRLAPFVKAIREKYPEVKIIGSSGPSSSGKEFDYLWPEMKRLKVDLVDEHYYKDPDWFLNNANRYDLYDRKGPAVFAGEYACHVPNKANNFRSALYESAFMTGLERNADIVHMCTYAPLFAHVDAWQWRPDMIWFDNISIVKTPNYYVQQLYAQNKGTHVLPLTMDKKAISGQDSLYASAVLDKNKNEIIVKISNTSRQDKDINIAFDHTDKKIKIQPKVEVIYLSANLNDVNSIEHPDAVIPRQESVQIIDKILRLKVKASSFGVYKIGIDSGK